MIIRIGLKRKEDRPVYSYSLCVKLVINTVVFDHQRVRNTNHTAFRNCLHVHGNRFRVNCPKDCSVSEESIIKKSAFANSSVVFLIVAIIAMIIFALPRKTKSKSK